MKRVIEGDVYLPKVRITELPDLSDCEVTGDFYCAANQLTSLKGSPKRVGEGFFCQDNQLTSLEGAPTSVGRDFHCHNNPAEFTKKDVQAVCSVGGRIFTCDE